MKNTSSSSGFTLIELLVVIILVGILSAIALPTFLGQAAKGRQTEAKSTIGSVNLGQVAYRTENSKYAESMDELALGLPLNTNNYLYEIAGAESTATITAKSKDAAVKSYAGGVVTYQNVAGDSAIASIICESKVASVRTPPIPILDPAKNTAEDAAQCDPTQVQL